MANTSKISFNGFVYQFNPDYTKELIAQKDSTPVKIWGVDEIKNLLRNNDLFVLRSLLKLYSFQTEAERCNENTTDSNGVGFNSFDADVLCNIAKQCCEKFFITVKQINYVRNKIMKYSGQITRIANGGINHEML